MWYSPPDRTGGTQWTGQVVTPPTHTHTQDRVWLPPLDRTQDGYNLPPPLPLESVWCCATGGTPFAVRHATNEELKFFLVYVVAPSYILVMFLLFFVKILWGNGYYSQGNCHAQLSCEFPSFFGLVVWSFNASYYISTTIYLLSLALKTTFPRNIWPVLNIIFSLFYPNDSKLNEVFNHRKSPVFYNQDEFFFFFHNVLKELIW